MQTHTVDLTPLPRERASMFYRGRHLGDSDSPLYDAARALLALGLAEGTDRIATRRDGTPCMRAQVAWAAERTTTESNRRVVRVVRFREYESDIVERVEKIAA